MHYDPPLTQLPSGSARLICVSPPTQFAYHDGGLITTAASVTTNGLWTFKTMISNVVLILQRNKSGFDKTVPFSGFTF